MKDIIHLVKKAQQGDETAYLELFQQFEVDIYRTAYVYLKNQEDALDVVQETAYRSFKSITSLKEPKFFKTWLIRIAISCSIDLLRQRKKVVQLKPEYYEGNKDGEDDNLPLSLSLKDLIDLLDEDEKSVIILKFYHDYTIQQTAEILSIPLGSVKTILYRALKKLRRLTEEGDLYEQ
ncbi:RNA polymerase sigma-70 factor (ECF subfamily) [Paenibacillus anaericanus]|uniref:sigma-70 family RNA polymerase sigma factor n=1 Tax=Paenibacillus anaericanus TaxID=170367 RepID=UPI00278171F6|nr:sigma-70 family RNA polymerase sigma factor [Paenibacillus anaericanus]MDQ0090474.1 RNA polymerase sigma-70 factor (ECF subfamily) [Paenibacillus anaericanus]